jgi:hypothetical protein
MFLSAAQAGSRSGLKMRGTPAPLPSPAPLQFVERTRPILAQQSR